MLTPEQLEKRKNGLGASDTPIIMGYSSYMSPYELYLQKVGLLDIEEEETELQYWGKKIEPLIAQTFGERHDVEVTFPDTLYHRDYPYIFANLDGYVAAENAPVECKMANSFQRKAWDDAYEDGMPLNYLIQVAKQVGVVNSVYGPCEKGYCPVLIGGFDYKEFTYTRDIQLEKKIFQADHDFWDCVVKRIQPDAITVQDCRLKYAETNPNKTKMCTYQIGQYFADLLNLKTQIKELEELQEHHKFLIMDYMKDAECLTDENDNVIVTWKKNKKGSRVFNCK